MGRFLPPNNTVVLIPHTRHVNYGAVWCGSVPVDAFGQFPPPLGGSAYGVWALPPMWKQPRNCILPSCLMLRKPRGEIIGLADGLGHW